MAIDIDPDLGHLDGAIESVEFKVSVRAGDEHKVQALLAKESAKRERRTLYFYDTKDLVLYQRGLVVRSRVMQGGSDDSTVKLRPVDLSSDGAGWRKLDGLRIELDVVGNRRIVSAKLEGKPDPGEIEAVEAGRRSVASLFSGTQENLVNAFAPKSVTLRKLEVLGPVDVRKWELENLKGFPHKLCVEEWSLPDASRFLELSFKVFPDGASNAESAFSDLLTGLGIDSAGDQVPRAPRVLEFFADRLDHA